MCGISGLFLGSADVSNERLGLATQMNARLAHRGPDGNDVWRCNADRIALGHTRLAVIDLSPAGAQPRLSASGRMALTFNGEIYNFVALREELRAAGVKVETESDSEVLIELIEHVGVSRALQKLDGMFAFAVWDRCEKTLTLARDRAGEKPLYYANLADGSMAFASELKALIAHPDFDRSLDKSALSLYLRHGYIQAPHTIFECAKKVRPGCSVVVQRDGNVSDSAYWDPFASNAASRSRRFQGDYGEAVETLDRLLRDSVSLRMISDVPIGCFLSGGVDSSAVAALMQEASSKKVRTFTIGFGEKEYDESDHAAAVADHIGTQHTTLTATGQDALDLVDRLPGIYCEPLSDSSQLPTLLVSALAREHITVALSGDGGDELFAGYMQYPWLGALWRTVRWMPPAVRRAVFSSMALVPKGVWKAPLRLASPVLPSRLRGSLGAYRLQRLFEVAAAPTIGLAHRELVSDCRQPSRLAPGSVDPGDWFSNVAAHPADASVVQLLTLLDFVQYLPADLLAKLDRASMSVALETRVPILDHKVAEFAWSLPDSFKLHGGVGKRILRDVLYRRVPSSLIDRPKMGFRVPVSAWLRGPLKGWGEDLISESALRETGLFDVAAVTRTWSKHQSGEANMEHRLWSVLMFQSWTTWLANQPTLES